MRIILTQEEVTDILHRAFKEDESIGVRVTDDQKVEFCFKDFDGKTVFNPYLHVEITNEPV